MNLLNTSSSQGYNDEVREMIEALPPGSSEYDAAGLEAEDLEELLQREPFARAAGYIDSDGGQRLDRYVVFKNVAPDAMRDFSNLRHLGRSKDQSLTYHLLIINMISRDHASAICYFEKLLEGKLDEMRPRLSLELRPCGGADVQGTTRTKCPDTSYLPRSLPHTRSAKWPSLVLEVGYSESASKLRNDASWWLTESRGDVRVVITVEIFCKHRVHLEMWQFRDGAARPRPVMTQEATVIKSGSNYSATGPMVIRFQDLLLRPPTGNGERDIVLGRDDLEGLVELALED
ncbi:hypothetical protein FQN52_004600 [Onygenales sp. PD_12]|nr:hypothetical protein FQN53_003783 [Emmonsiellopsis sp. PD_33]KAK2791684.1 hypothetical protein FQN52_004600 [Onygenales sp. PD_12]KAK2796592.1 hypothetical protein FQN51_009283 [Onygenales sp. PD_10]